MACYRSARKAAAPEYFARRLLERFTLGAGVENLFDKVYQDHLGGYNRVRESDIAVGDRINGMGRSMYLRLNARW